MISDVRLLFDGVTEKFPSTDSRLIATARLGQYQQFEGGVGKIHDGDVIELTASKWDAMSSLKLEIGETQVSEQSHEISFA